MLSRNRVAGYAAVAVAIAALLVAVAFLVVKVAPDELASTDGLTPAERAEEIGRVRTALLAFLAGLIASTGALFTGLTWRLNQRGQITERFTKAVDQLGNASPDIRQGGIYALERIASDAPQTHHDAVVSVLTAFVRERAPWPPDEPDSPQKRPRGSLTKRRPPTDVQAAMTVLGRRAGGHDRQVLNLTSVDLRGAELTGASFPNTDFAEAHFEEAEFARADLRGAIFARADVRAAAFHRARLDQASLVWAHLQFAEFWGASLRHVHWQGAHLEGARLTGASLDVTGPATGGQPALMWVTVSNETTWPDGFSHQDALDHGARAIEAMSDEEIARAHEGLPPIPDHLLNERSADQ